MDENILEIQNQLKMELSHTPVNTHKVTAILSRIAHDDIGLYFSHLSKLPLETLADLLLLLPEWILQETIARMPRNKTLKSINLLKSDEATDLMQRVKKIDPALYHKFYEQLQPTQQEQIAKLEQYKEDKAGAYMQTEMLKVTSDEQIADIKNKINYFKKHRPNMPLIHVFVTDKKGHFLATLHFSDLMLFDDQKNIQELINEIHPQRPLFIRDNDSISDVIRLFEELDQVALAVVDREKRLVGQILFDDIYDLIRHEEGVQAMRMAGTRIESEESLGKAQKVRLKWILINLFAILFASLVVYYYQSTIQQIVALAVIMPVVAALGGNVGNQAVTVTVRRLALNEISWFMAKKVLLKETLIGTVNGMIIGAVVGLIGYLWFGNPLLGAVAGVAVTLNLAMAGFFGSVIPFIFKKSGVDPAIVSPLLLTTLTDTMGFFLFLGLANVILL